MRTQDRSLDDDDRAMADLAEVPDWTKVWGPAAVGRDAVVELAERVAAATGWRPWTITDVHDSQASWGLVTRRDTVMQVFPDAVLPDSPRSGWSAYQIAPDDIPAAEAGLDHYWRRHLDLAARHWGRPAYVGSLGQPGFPGETGQVAVGRRHLAVWVRPGAEFHLYAEQPEADSPTRAVGINYSVYAAGVTR